MTPVRRCLVTAQMSTHLHPYVISQVCLPSNKHHLKEVTVADALLLHNCIPHFHLPMPWLTREERPTIAHWVNSGGTQSHVSTTPVRSTPFPSTTMHTCPHCKVPNATHASFACPILNRCYYCKSLNHHPNDCPCHTPTVTNQRLGVSSPTITRMTRLLTACL